MLKSHCERGGDSISTQPAARSTPVRSTQPAASTTSQNHRQGRNTHEIRRPRIQSDIKRLSGRPDRDGSRVRSVLVLIRQAVMDDAPRRPDKQISSEPSTFDPRFVSRRRRSKRLTSPAYPLSSPSHPPPLPHTCAPTWLFHVTTNPTHPAFWTDDKLDYVPVSQRCRGWDVLPLSRTRTGQHVHDVEGRGRGRRSSS